MSGPVFLFKGLGQPVVLHALMATESFKSDFVSDSTGQVSVTQRDTGFSISVSGLLLAFCPRALGPFSGGL